ncbi:hypothetical protein COR50_12615 [Chitinophaga caeni]|uniref:UspA domain-containing protein n=1 Tax=Chitinophaga caeni TaxID=2029983 RepID=A0A291QVQ7_9BACT|nr:hypothetical protein [Chitinophaga caeni]ATL47943.1 hypothetical protein COR50_12615 [Chitinophaga caeni]
MKNILIPTDFSIRSLGYVHAIAEQHAEETINIIYFHALKMPSSLMDLMSFTRDKSHIKLMSRDFCDACEILKNKYGKSFGKLDITYFHGDTKVAFKNFLLANNIDVIALPQDFEYHAASPESYDPSALIRRSGWELMTVKFPQKRNYITRATISELLTDNIHQ